MAYYELIFIVWGKQCEKLLQFFEFISVMMLQFSVVTYFGDSVTQPVGDLCISLCACSMCSDIQSLVVSCVHKCLWFVFTFLMFLNSVSVMSRLVRMLSLYCVL